ncbi:MAG TPA: tRNA pseudouridine(55) synthase TruB [Acidimicrobiales bacterium]|nr:tRNA pseudouridine(55) synthase TruB [Acidimicrobiales bacterium]
MIDGLVVVDKPAGWTSHDVVGRCRRIFGQRRVGHSGTLDPGATGVLLVGLGRVTRLLRFLTALSKSYEGDVVLGVATSTLDDAGDETGRWEMSGITLENVRRAAVDFVGPIMQVPPMVSAVQVGGRRLYALARDGVEVEREARPVVVHRLEVSASVEPGVFPISVSCSSGTFVRSLAADLGTALGGGAHLRRLRRTAIGSFEVGEARTLDELEVAGPDAVLSPAAALRDYSPLVVEPDVAVLVAHGRPLDAARLSVDGPGPWAVLDQDGSLLAVYEAAQALLKPAVVLPVG